MAAGWDSYIDSVCAASLGNCDQVCIIGLVGGGFWTTDCHEKSVRVTAKEAVVIANALAADDCSVFQQNGVVIGGVKYQFLRKDENALYAKKKDHGSLTIQKTKTAIVIAHTGEGGQAGSTNKAVDNVCNYLEQNNF